MRVRLVPQLPVDISQVAQNFSGCDPSSEHSPSGRSHKSCASLLHSKRGCQKGDNVKKLIVLLLAAASLVLSGCSTSSRVVVNPGSALVINTAYVVLHGGNSEDVDAHVQRELMAHGITVKAGPELADPGTDIIVRYNDNWRWDMTMYLSSLDIQIYDANSGTLMGSGSWKNSALHGYHSAEKVTRKVMEEIFKNRGQS